MRKDTDLNLLSYNDCQICVQSPACMHFVHCMPVTLHSIQELSLYNQRIMRRIQVTSIQSMCPSVSKAT